MVLLVAKVPKTTSGSDALDPTGRVFPLHPLVTWKKVCCLKAIARKSQMRYFTQVLDVGPPSQLRCQPTTRGCGYWL